MARETCLVGRIPDHGILVLADWFVYSLNQKVLSMTSVHEFISVLWFLSIFNVICQFSIDTGNNLKYLQVCAQITTVLLEIMERSRNLGRPGDLLSWRKGVISAKPSPDGSRKILSVVFSDWDIIGNVLQGE